MAAAMKNGARNPNAIGMNRRILRPIDRDVKTPAGSFGSKDMIDKNTRPISRMPIACRAAREPIRWALLIVLAGCTPAASPPKQSRKPKANPIALPTLVQSDATFPELEQAHAQHRSNVWVEGGGTVTRLLRDDTKRPRHQRFVVKIGTGPNAFTVMIAHNIDLAPRVPFKKGDEITFRGEYIWNEKGGILHWTHHDPSGRHLPGWIQHNGQIYQ